MWKDINNKTGHKNLQGNEYLYGNMKLLDSGELSNAFADGIQIFIKPTPKPEPVGKVFKRAKRQARQEVKNRFDIENIKPVVHGGQQFNGGIESVSELHLLLVLAEMSGEIDVFIPLSNDSVRKKTLAEAKDIVIAVGNDYKDKMGIKRASIREINKTVDKAELDLTVLPWPQPKGVF